MKWFKRILFFLFSAALCIGLYVKSDLDGWFIKKISPAELAKTVEPNMQIFKPLGTGPFKTVLMFHGCGSGKEQQQYWGEVLQGWGFAAVYVDSYAGRDIDYKRAKTQVCKGKEFRGAERAGDVLTSIAWANRQTWVDKDNIVLAGWSHGAWSVMDAFALHQQGKLPHNLNAAPEADLSVIKQTVLFYPYCGIASNTNSAGWSVKSNILLIEVANDSVVGNQVCNESFNWITQSGNKLQHVVFEEVDHGFDTDVVSTQAGRTKRSPIEKATAALENAKVLVKTFLD